MGLHQVHWMSIRWWGPKEKLSILSYKWNRPCTRSFHSLFLSFTRSFSTIGAYHGIWSASRLTSGVWKSINACTFQASKDESLSIQYCTSNFQDIRASCLMGVLITGSQEVHCMRNNLWIVSPPCYLIKVLVINLIKIHGHCIWWRRKFVKGHHNLPIQS